MIKKLGLKLKEQKGFTLIELLAVIVILGILAAIAIPSISNIIQNSRVDAVKADALAVMNAGKLYLTQVPEDEEILYSELTEYVDNTSLDTDGDDALKIDVDGGVLTLTAKGKAGNVDVIITSATFEMLNNDSLWDEAESGDIEVK